MADIRFTAYGKVVGKARARVTRYGTYTPKSTREYEALVRKAFKESGCGKLEGELAMRLDVYRKLPKSRPKKLQSEPDTFKPDATNITKAVEDALNGLAYDDDAQITLSVCDKHPRTRIDEERVEVVISTR